MLVDSLEKTAFLSTVDHIDCLFSDSAKMDEQLHSETAGKKRFICCLAHFEKKLDARIFTLPRQHVRVSFNDHDVDQVESLWEKQSRVSYTKKGLLSHYVCCLNLTRAQISDQKL